jgi:hypothetical protein
MEGVGQQRPLVTGRRDAQRQEWLGHANLATTRLSDRRQSRPGESPTFKVGYETGESKRRENASVAWWRVVYL